ncbi:MAG TPA: HDOD domain-containing protein [Thermodesulfovibrionales bacterium]|nr:HDOD domain-containing protein [Thermodesulfovibrionales bacterium]
MIELSRLFVERITRLPTVPYIAQEILNRMSDDMIAIDRLEEIIEHDPSISAKVLSVANSAFFRSANLVTTISDAIFRLGTRNTSSIALGIALLTAFESKNQDKPLKTQRVYSHSIAVGILARLLSRDFHFEYGDEIFACGILHDLGFLVLNTYFADEYRKVMDRFTEGGSLLEAETEVLGHTHPVIGAWLADNWDLPDVVLEAITYHHTPSLSSTRITSLIHIADYLVSKHSLRVMDKDPNYPLDPEALIRLDITEADLLDIEANIDREIFTGGIFSLA